MRGPSHCRPLAAVAAVVATLAIGVTRARADEAPGDFHEARCTAPGQPCSTAGPQEDQEGTCAAATCTKQLPTRDGGTASVPYPCFYCTTGGAKRSTSKRKSKSSDCAVAAERGDLGSETVAAFLIGALILAARRRRGA